MTKRGIFKTADESIKAAAAAQKEYVAKFTIEDRDRFIAKVREVFVRDMTKICRLEYDETKLGRYEDKLIKNNGAVVDTPGTEMLPKEVFVSDKGLTVDYFAPYGVIGAVTPVTNAAATICANGIAALASGNSIVFNPHPSATQSAHLAVDLFNEALEDEGVPLNMVTMTETPTMDTLDAIIAAREVKLMIGTGGPGMVKTLMSSGKKVIAAGAGNPPAIVDETADIKLAAVTLIQGASFENNLLCVSEKEIFVVESVYDEFIKEFQAAGARLLSRDDADKVTEITMHELENGTYAVNKQYVGKDANVILKAAGLDVEGDLRLAFFEAENNDPYVMTEQMMPIIPVVRCKDFSQAMEWAYAAEKDNRHSASVWTESIKNATEFGRLINTTLFAQNGWTLAPMGMGGSGINSPTIATPTGEGPLHAGILTRRRRFAIAGGYNLL